MAATTLFFNGILTSIPGAYSKVNAAALESIGLGASGIVAVLGTCQGGKPVGEMTSAGELERITRPGKEDELFRSGDLLEAIPFVFTPSSDEEIEGGAQLVIPVKVNPATQSAATLPNAQGDALTWTSKDYGAHTEQINISITTATPPLTGKLLVITFEDLIETVDDLGGDDLLTLTYDGSDADAWDTVTALVETAGDLSCDATRDVGGLDGDLTTPLAAPGTIEVLSNAGGDVGQVVTVYGLTGAGAVIREVFVLNGTAAQVGTATYAAGDVLGVEISGTIAGTVSVQASGGGAVVFAVSAGADPVGGLVRGVAMFVSGSAVTIVLDAAGTEDVILVGTGVTGAILTETLALNGTTPVPGAALFSTITAIVVGDVAAARTLTASAEAAKSQASIQNTLQKLADYFNARSVGTDGFECTLLTGTISFDPDNLDTAVSAVDCFSPAEPGFAADLYEMITWVTLNSQLVTVALAAGTTGGALSNTAAPVFLAGGGEGTTQQANWQAGLNLLRTLRINTVVPVSSDPAVHAACEAHCAYMGGAGRNERDTVVGIQNAGQTAPPTKTEIKTQILALNSRHVRVVAESMDRFNKAGVRTTFQPHFTALLVAGMQAGSPVGTSLTNKYASVLDVARDSSWNPSDDAEEMIQAGLLFLERREDIGHRWVRNITSYLKAANLAFIEGSVNEAVNFSAYNFRTAMEFVVGKKAFAGTEKAGEGVAIGILDGLIGAEALTDYRSLSLDLTLDVLEVAVEMAPVIPINFVPTTIHLVTG